MLCPKGLRPLLFFVAPIVDWCPRQARLVARVGVHCTVLLPPRVCRPSLRHLLPFPVVLSAQSVFLCRPLMVLLVGCPRLSFPWRPTSPLLSPNPPFAGHNFNTTPSCHGWCPIANDHHHPSKDRSCGPDDRTEHATRNLAASFPPPPPNIKGNMEHYPPGPETHLARQTRPPPSTKYGEKIDV